MATDAYRVRDVSSWELMETEVDGRTEHPWLRDPDADWLWLWKPVVVSPDRRQGEDWAEKVASELGVAMGVPCAEVDLAEREGRPGCISRDLRPRGWEEQPGEVLLAGLLPGYQTKVKGRAGHSLVNIFRALREYGPPPYAACPEGFAAFDVFAGYLVFDALIANRDRHDHNWAVLRPPPEHQRGDALCGSYDHAHALGFNLTDRERLRWLDTSVEVWAERGTAHKFEHAAPGTAPTLVTLAHTALGFCTSSVRDHWLASVSGLSPTMVGEIAAAVPELSEPTVSFITELVTINRRRILDER